MPALGNAAPATTTKCDLARRWSMAETARRPRPDAPSPEGESHRAGAGRILPVPALRLNCRFVFLET